MIQIAETVDELRGLTRAFRGGDHSIGFVPTMGALHAGHRSLIARSVGENDVTVVSIFVNPIQFAAGEDIERYPRTGEADLRICEEAGADIVFRPAVFEMYPAGFSTQIDMSGMTEVMCGRSRPDHFRGVLTVVGKLFLIAMPDRAYFGEKDAQQLAVIKKMAHDLNMPIEIIGCPTVREKDGLAMSSRNTYLNEEERRAARCLFRALARAEKVFASVKAEGAGIAEIVQAADIANTVQTAEAEIRAVISAEPLAKTDYIEVLDADTFATPAQDTKKVICAVAVYIGSTRLIDNLTISI
jgi:pantoate--beta-alanine ligase